MYKPQLSKRSGFSLIELVIAVTILSILAGVIAPRVSQFSEKAQISRAANDVKAISRALDYMYADLNAYPRNTAQGVDPGLTSNARVPNALRPNWEGPYMAAWPDTHPWGGNYDYQFGAFTNWNFDGTAGNECYINLRGGTLNRAILTSLDEAIDDGVFNTGAVQHNNNNVLSVFVGEGTRW